MQTCVKVTGGIVNEHSMYSVAPHVDNSSNLTKQGRASDDLAKQAIGVT